MLDNKICILVVDDEVRMVKGLSDFLKAKKYAVLIAFNGEEALDVYYDNNEKIDLILLDIMMPKIDGISVLKEIKENSKMPIIMLTAKSEDYDEIEGLNVGADDYITKPFSPAVLLARIENILNRYSKNLDNEIVIDELRLNLSSYSLFINENKVDLTRREFDLLSYLIKNKIRRW